MISAAAPHFLFAGTALAVIPVVLHFLARRPPAREPLPTARFLTSDARTLLRLRRRPTDLLLLALRVLFVVALGAAFAGVVWTGDRSGTVTVVLLDAGAVSEAEWSDRVQTTRDLSEASESAPESVILAYGLDDGLRTIAPGDLAQLQPGTRPATAADGLRALRSAIASGGWERAEAVWVTTPSWRLWSRGVGLSRASIWPGGVRFAPPPVSAATRAEDEGRLLEPGPAADPPTARVLGGADEEPLERAIAALGASSRWVFASSPTPTELTRLLETARAGGVVVVGGMTSLSDAIEPESEPESPFSTSLDGFVIRASLEGTDGAAAPVVRTQPGTRVVAVFENGTPAAASVRVGEGCFVYAALPFSHPDLTLSPRYPDYVRALTRGCPSLARQDELLDRGARWALERPDLPSTVEASALGAPGDPLTPWLLGLTLALLLAELVVTRRSNALDPEGSS